jgi:hypothetical protein
MEDSQYINPHEISGYDDGNGKRRKKTPIERLEKFL